MKLYFLRHGEADWPGWNKPDDERPMTKKGKAHAQAVFVIVTVTAFVFLAAVIFMAPL